MHGVMCGVHSVVCQPTTGQIINSLSYSPSPPLFPGEMLLQSRGCVDRGSDSTKHKLDLSPFTPASTSPKCGNTGRKQGRPDESVCQHTCGTESRFRVRRKKTVGVGESSERDGICVEMKEDIFSTEKHAELIGLIKQLAYNLNSPPWRIRQTALTLV